MSDFKDEELFPKQAQEDIEPTGPKYLGMPLPLAPGVGKQFIRVYRGLHASRLGDHEDMSTLDTNDIGGHWSYDRDAAMGFASGNTVYEKHGKNYLDSVTRRKNGLHSLLLEGFVHKDDIEDDRKILQDGGVFRPGHPEKEVPIVGGGKVHLTKVSRYKINKPEDEDQSGDDIAKMVNQPEFVESQEFKDPLTLTTPQSLSRFGWYDRRKAEGKQDSFDTEVNQKFNEKFGPSTKV